MTSGVNSGLKKANERAIAAKLAAKLAAEQVPPVAALGTDEPAAAAPLLAAEDAAEAAEDVLGSAAGVDAGVDAGVLGVVGAHNAAARHAGPPALEDVGDVQGMPQDGPARRVDLNDWWTGSLGAKDEHRYALYLRVAMKLFRRRSDDDPFALPADVEDHVLDLFRGRGHLAQDLRKLTVRVGRRAGLENSSAHTCTYALCWEMAALVAEGFLAVRADLDAGLRLRVRARNPCWHACSSSRRPSQASLCRRVRRTQPHAGPLCVLPATAARLQLLCATGERRCAPPQACTLQRRCGKLSTRRLRALSSTTTTTDSG